MKYRVTIEFIVECGPNENINKKVHDILDKGLNVPMNEVIEPKLRIVGPLTIAVPV